MKVVLIAALAAMLSACATQLGGNERSVIIRAGAAMAGKAQAEADVHCEKYGRHAVLSGKINAIDWAFDCVK